jgi:hypothetical protein
MRTPSTRTMAWLGGPVAALLAGATGLALAAGGGGHPARAGLRDTLARAIPPFGAQRGTCARSVPQRDAQPGAVAHPRMHASSGTPSRTHADAGADPHPHIRLTQARLS